MKISRIDAKIYGAKKRLLIVLTMSRLKGGLRVTGKTGGLSLLVEGGDNFSVSSARATGKAVLIYTTAGYNAVSGLEECRLSYTPTEKEHIADNEGRLPAFEDMPLLEEGNYSPYFHCGSISPVMPLRKPWSGLSALDIPPIEAFRPFVCNANVISPRVLNKMCEYPKDSIAFVRFTVDCGEETPVELMWGCSGLLKCWADGELLGSCGSKELLFGTMRSKLRLSRGRHVITAAFSNRLYERGDKGITLRLRREDGGELPMLVRDDASEYFF